MNGAISMERKMQGNTESITYNGNLIVEDNNKRKYTLLYSGAGLRNIQTEDNFYVEESYTIVKKRNNGNVKDVVINRAVIVNTVDSEGRTLDGTYRSRPDKASITYCPDSSRTLIFY